MLNKKDLLTRIYLTLKQFILQKSSIIQQRFVAFKKNVQESVCNFIKTETPAQVFSCEFSKNFQSRLHGTPANDCFCKTVSIMS